MLIIHAYAALIQAAGIFLILTAILKAAASRSN
jgi:hypothetical protein